MFGLTSTAKATAIEILVAEGLAARDLRMWDTARLKLGAARKLITDKGMLADIDKLIGSLPRY